MGLTVSRSVRSRHIRAATIALIVDQSAHVVSEQLIMNAQSAPLAIISTDKVAWLHAKAYMSTM